MESIGYTERVFYIISTVLLCLAIVVASYFAFVASYSYDSCRFSRSDTDGGDAQSIKFCMNHTLNCNAFDSSRDYIESSISFRTQTTENISFPTDFNTYYGVCINYTDTMGAGCSPMGVPDFGYCTATNTVHLFGISTQQGTDQWNTLVGNALSQLINTNLSDGQTITDELSAFYDVNSKKFVYEGPSLSLRGTCMHSNIAANQGIFGSNKIIMESQLKNPYKKLALENLMNTNESIRNLKTFQNFQTKEEADGISQKLRCVDPSAIIPCGSRIFDGVSYKTPGKNDGVYFCSYDIDMNKYDNQNNGNKTGYITNRDPNSNSFSYQTQGFGSDIQNSAFKPGVLANNPGVGDQSKADEGDNLYSIGARGQKITQDANTTYYNGNRVFCGGTTPGSTNNRDDPLNSTNFTPAFGSGKRYPFGF